jgi:hypothetical protein
VSDFFVIFCICLCLSVSALFLSLSLSLYLCLCQASARADELQVLLLRSKAMFDIKEKKLRAAHEAQLHELKTKLAASTKVWSAVGELEKKEQTLMQSLKETRIQLEDAQHKVAYQERHIDFLKKELKSATHLAREAGRRNNGNGTTAAAADGGGNGNDGGTDIGGSVLRLQHQMQQLQLELSSGSGGSSADEYAMVAFAGSGGAGSASSSLAHPQGDAAAAATRQTQFFEARLKKKDDEHRRLLNEEQRVKQSLLSRVGRLETALLASNAEQERLTQQYQSYARTATISLCFVHVSLSYT